LLKGKINDIEITFEPTGDFDGWLTAKCPDCSEPKRIKLSRLKPKEPLICACGAKKINAEEFRKYILNLPDLARQFFKGLLK